MFSKQEIYLSDVRFHVKCHMTFVVNKPRKFGHWVNYPRPVNGLRHFIVDNFHCRFSILKLIPLLCNMFDYLSSKLLFHYRQSRCEECSKKRKQNWNRFQRYQCGRTLKIFRGIGGFQRADSWKLQSWKSPLQLKNWFHLWIQISEKTALPPQTIQ